MNRRHFLQAGSLATAAVATPACALIFDGPKDPDERDYDRILWGYLILDVLFTGLIGLLIDFLSGAIYARAGSPRMSSRGRRIELCPDATVQIATLGRARPAALFLRNHLPGCPHCSDALRRHADAPEADMGPLVAEEGDVYTEPVHVELASA